MRNIACMLGRFYTSLSLAMLPVAIVIVLLLLIGFRENGPQSQGLGALAVIAAIVLGSLAINAIIASILSYTVISIRPTFRQFVIYVASISALAALYSLAVVILS